MSTDAQEPGTAEPSDAQSALSPASSSDAENRGHGHNPARRTMLTAAIGVIFGDIGTSPLYAIREAFFGAHPMPVDDVHVLGVLSLVFWALTIVVSLKYSLLMMRADNKGQGGSLALLALATQAIQRSGRTWLSPLVVVLGISAGALFYADSMITPAISVLSAVEGLDVAVPGFHPYVIPITLAILVSLFLFQSRGTAAVGRFFGPIVAVWFTTLGVIGIVNIVQSPYVLSAVMPWYAFKFFLLYPLPAFLVLGAVFLVVTGTEALYADMGHFGRWPIRVSWYCFVLPCLVLNYFGQGAFLLRNPDANNPFYMMVPEWFTLPLVGMATMATIIASQAVITGSFSVTRQASQLGFLPRMATIHTSASEHGQIYLPFVNWILLAAVILLVLGFQTSSTLANIYGLAISATLLIDTLLVALVMFLLWRWNIWFATGIIATFLVVDLAFFSANATKIATGGWFSILTATVIFILLTTWKKGRRVLGDRMAQEAMPEDLFLKSLNPETTRVPGTAFFLSGSAEGVPHALLHNLKHNKIIHERVVFLTVITEEVPYVPDDRRIKVHHIGRRFYRMLMRYGYMDQTNIPNDLATLTPPTFEINEMETSYFLGRETLIPSRRPGMVLWREGLFAWMSRSATSAMDFFKLPPDRVVEVGTQIEI